MMSKNAKYVGEDCRDCYWLYIVTNCSVSQASSLQEERKAGKMPALHTIKDPARFSWHEVSKVQHYWMEVNAMTRPDLPAGRQVMVREGRPPYGGEST